MLTECCWLFPTPIAAPQRWVRHDRAGNWFQEQGDQSLWKELDSAYRHHENKGYVGCKLCGW